MSFEEKFDNAKDKIAGKAKELEGKITGDKAREVEGKTQNVKGEAKMMYKRFEMLPMTMSMP